MPKRLDDWMERLDRYVAQTDGRPFVWGDHDCALDAAAMLEAITGKDPSRKYRRKYATKAEGLRLVRADGFKDHVEALSKGLEKIPPGEAMPGDLVELRGHVAGIVQGRFIYAMTEAGRARVDFSEAIRAWRV